MAETIQGHEAVGGATKRGAPDTSVVLPPAVRAAAERSEALVRQAKEAREAAPPSDNQPLNVTVVPPPERAAPNGVAVVNFDPNNPDPPRESMFTPIVRNMSGATQPQPQPAPQPQPQTQQPQTQQPQTQEDWEHQYRSLKGRHDRDAEEKKALARQLQDTQRLLAQVGNAPASAPPNPSPSLQNGSGVRFGPPPPPGGKITDKERSEYGEELLDVVARRAQEVYEPALNQVVNELNQLKRQVGGVQNSVAHDASIKMYDDIRRELPNFEEINNSQEFSDWLDQPDPVSGTIRRPLLMMAHQRNMGSRVLAIFKSFLRDWGYSQSQPPLQLPPPAPMPPQNGLDLAQYAAPGRAKPGASQVPQEKPIFDASDISQLYRDKIAGKYAGRDEEFSQIERALILAANEGRLRK